MSPDAQGIAWQNFFGAHLASLPCLLSYQHELSYSADVRPHFRRLVPKNEVAMTAMVQEPVRTGLPQAKRLLKELFGFNEFRGGQADVVTRLLEGRSTLAIFPTGGGKSL